MSKGKVLVAMSGGVDSSVAAALLQRQGYEVVGCFMRLGSPGEAISEGLTEPDPQACGGTEEKGGHAARPVRIGHQGCCSINDAKDAQRVAARLGVRFYVLNFKRDFGRIIDYFTDEYNAGRTPNPCVRCNDWLKFGKLDEYARSIDAHWVATGHYARIEPVAGQPSLLRGLDHAKDQSYVLFGTRRQTLRRMLLPIGSYRKSQVRALAAELGLAAVADKPDSQEICFVPDMNYAAVVASLTPGGFAEGRLVDLSGRTVGAHAGHQHFTIGQRRGLGIAADRPLYVIDKHAASNTVTVGPREMLLAAGAAARQVNWLIDEPADDLPIACHVKIRSNAMPTPGVLRRIGDDQIEVTFDSPQFAVAPGQAMVCYDNDRVIAGGWIDRAIKTQ